MKKYRTFILLSGLLLGSFFARATDGKSVPSQLEGYVKDAVTRKPVAGVLVCAVAPGANQSKEAITDADGYFRFAELPSLQVNLHFGKKGYQPCKRSGVVVREKTTVKIIIDFLREDIVTDADSNTDNSEYPLLRMLEI
jgi:hypothetical protein